jgi:hypothetical protein
MNALLLAILTANLGNHPGHLEGATPLDCALVVYDQDEDGRWVKAHYGVGILMARAPSGPHWQVDKIQHTVRFVYDDPADFMTFEYDPETLRIGRFFKTTDGLLLRACAVD